MGQTLDKPQVNKESVSGSGNGLKFAACGMQGWRTDMEDAHTTLTPIGVQLSDVAFFAVFDGHAGSYTSKICSEDLPKYILEVFKREGISSIPESKDVNSEDNVKLKDALVGAFIAFDDELKKSEPYTSLRESCGSTAIAALVTPSCVIFCNCGDSRGFLSRSDVVNFETSDHKPSNPVERKRIEDSGGTVSMDRVNGNLAVSRALGDFSFKMNDSLPSNKQAVSPEPDVTIIPRNNDQFLILACDGIWDVMSCEEVRKFVHSRLLVTHNLKSICEDLIDNCLMKDSRDNMSVLIVLFENAPNVIEEEVKLEKKYEEEIKCNIKEIMSEKSATPSLVNMLNQLKDYEYVKCATSNIGIFAKTRFIEKIMNEIDPKRETDRDYSSMGPISVFPMALQAIQQLVNPDNELSSSPISASPSKRNQSDSSDMEQDEN